MNIFFNFDESLIEEIGVKFTDLQYGQKWVNADQFLMFDLSLEFMSPFENFPDAAIETVFTVIVIPM